MRIEINRGRRDAFKLCYYQLVYHYSKEELLLCEARASRAFSVTTSVCVSLALGDSRCESNGALHRVRQSHWDREITGIIQRIC